MNKKSQITLFISVSIVLLVILALGLYVVKAVNQENKLDYNSIPSISNYAENIHETSLTCSLYTLGKSGGYLEVEPDRLAELEESKKLASDFIAMSMPVLTNWAPYQEQGYEITEGEINTEIMFAKKEVVANIFHKIKASNNNNHNINLEKFQVEKNVRYKEIYEYAKNIYNDIDINLNKLSQTDLDTNIYIIKNSNVFVFTDETSIINNMPYKFIFTKEK